jgi:RNA polymerase sigma factor (sigma-70 family)
VSLEIVSTRAVTRLSAEDCARLREMARPVARAARLLIKQERTTLRQEDLEALGTLAVWRKLPSYDPARAAFDRWAFYQAIRAMARVSQGEREETLFQSAARRGAHGYVANDDRPAESDFHHDTPETDLARLRERRRRIVAAALLQTVLERVAAGTAIEQDIAAGEAVRAVHEEIARLSDEQRTYLRMRFWKDAEAGEVAAQMGIPERTLRRRWAETRDLLEARLRGRGIFGIPEGFGEAADAMAASGNGGDR